MPTTYQIDGVAVWDAEAGPRAAVASRVLDVLAVSVAADERARCEAKIEAILDWPEHERAYLYTLLHAQGMNLERAARLKREAGWR